MLFIPCLVVILAANTAPACLTDSPQHPPPRVEQQAAPVVVTPLFITLQLLLQGKLILVVTALRPLLLRNIFSPAIFHHQSQCGGS